MGMLYDAYKAHSPLLLTAGQHDQSFTVTEPILWSDLPPVATPFVKWATEARRLEDLPRIVRRAVKTALAQPSGPVRSEEHTSELQSLAYLVCRLLLEKKKKNKIKSNNAEGVTIAVREVSMLRHHTGR